MNKTMNNPIDQADLDSLSGGISIRSTPKNENEISFIASFGIFVAHITYFPAAAMALLNADRHWLGVDFDFLSYTVLIVCGTAIALTRVNEWGGRLVDWSRMLFLVATVVLVPFMLGFAALTFLYVALTGPSVLTLLWKGVIFFAFQFWYISGK